MNENDPDPKPERLKKKKHRVRFNLQSLSSFFNKRASPCCLKHLGNKNLVPLITQKKPTHTARQALSQVSVLIWRDPKSFHSSASCLQIYDAALFVIIVQRCYYVLIIYQFMAKTLIK